MAKIFQFDNSKVEKHNRATPMDARLWFKLNQPLLLWMANKSKDGRKLLRLEQTGFDRIDAIGHNFVTRTEYVKDGGTFFKPNYTRVNTTDFRVGAKWANIINYQWDWFCDLKEEYMTRLAFPKWYPAQQRINGLIGAHCTDVTAYPDPDVESTTVDGKVSRQADGTFSQVRDGAGDLTSDSGNEHFDCVALRGSGTGTDLLFMGRFIHLYDTSAITDTDEITAAVNSLYSVQNSVGVGAFIIDIVASTPASNTALVDADYGQLGTTVFAQNTTWTDAQYNTHTFNATGRAGISKTGVTKLGARLDWDVINSADYTAGVNQTSGMGLRSADYTGTDNDPKLVVTHVVPASFIPHFNILM